MAKKPVKWMQKAFAKNKGALHRQLGVPEDQPIPPSKIAKAAGSSNTKLRLRAQAALNAASVRAKKKMSQPKKAKK